MKNTVIKVENLSKYYQLGLIGGGTLREDVNRWIESLKRNKNNKQPSSGVMTGRESGEIWALNDVSFDVEEGEILGIIGRNGAGKSTLLKLLSRITAPTSGSIKIKGRVGSLLEVGTGFHPELTGRENTYLNGTILGMTRKEVDARLEEIVEFAELARFIDTPVKRYSSGMTVRLAFSVAAHLEPEILIIDEVLAVGDTEFQQKCIGKMEDVAGHGRTVLFVSHNMNVVQNLCTRGIVIEDGSVAYDGTINNAVQRFLMSDRNQTLDLDRSLFKGSFWNYINFSGATINSESVGKQVNVLPKSEIKIKIFGQAKKQIPDAEIFIILYREGIQVCTLFDADLKRAISIGEFESTFVIPPYLLMPGTYQIRIGAESKRVKEQVVSEYLPGFKVSASWDQTMQERRLGIINIPNPNGGRVQV